MSRMGAECDLSYDERDWMLEQPLLTWKALRGAPPIDDPGVIPLSLYKMWFDFAERYVMRHQLLALAFTQLPIATRQRLQLDTWIPPRIVFLRETVRGEAVLLANPWVEVNPHDPGEQAVLESCGSLGGKEYWQVCSRFSNIHHGGYGIGAIGDRKVSEWEMGPSSSFASLAMHEVQHLDAMTAVTAPGVLLDYRDPGVRASLEDTYSGSVSQHVLYKALWERRGIIVPGKGGRLELVDPGGTYLGDWE